MEIEEGSSGSAESSGGSDDEVEEGWGEEGSGEMAVQVRVHNECLVFVNHTPS